jgi:hypothetical protein
MNYVVKEKVLKSWEEEDFHTYYAHNMSHLFIVYVRIKKMEKWFYVSAALSGTIKNV